jgi:CheY-like chemotaxis protein
LPQGRLAVYSASRSAEGAKVEKELEILLVEDDPAEASRLTRALSTRGVLFQTHQVRHRDAFLRSISEHKPDVILVDLSASEFSGFAALDLAREQLPDVPLIFISQKFDQGLLFELYQCGAAGCVHRHRLEELAPLIRRVVADRSLASRRFKTHPPPRRPVTRPALATAQGAAVEAPLGLCSGCRLVQSPAGTWEPIESYLRKHERAWVTLTLCPACAGRATASPPNSPRQ